MYLISAEGYKNAGVDLLKKLVKFGQKRRTRWFRCSKQFWEIFEKLNNLSEDELNVKNSKKVYAKNDLMTTVIKRYRGGEKRRKKNRCI